MTSAAAGDDVLLRPAPFLSSVMQIEPQWIDYNGHLNMAYYNVMFDRAIDELWLKLGIGPGYMKERHGSTFTAECHVRYLREIHLGDPVQVSILLVGADEKRLHTFEELRHATEGWLSATSENMTIHIDMTARKTAPFPPDIRARIEALANAHAASRGPRASAERSRCPRNSGSVTQTRLRPRARPTTAETRNSTTAMKKMVLAISMEAPAMPPKPKMPAISAMIRNVTTQLNMTRPLFHFGFDIARDRQRRASAAETNPSLGTKVPRGSRRQNREKFCVGRGTKSRPEARIRPTASRRDNSCQIARRSPICPAILL